MTIIKLENSNGKGHVRVNFDTIAFYVWDDVRKCTNIAFPGPQEFSMISVKETAEQIDAFVVS